jgi:hypothetical protein
MGVSEIAADRRTPGGATLQSHYRFKGSVTNHSYVRAQLYNFNYRAWRYLTIHISAEQWVKHIRILQRYTTAT